MTDSVRRCVLLHSLHWLEIQIHGVLGVLCFKHGDDGACMLCKGSFFHGRSNLSSTDKLCIVIRRIRSSSSHRLYSLTFLFHNGLGLLASLAAVAAPSSLKVLSQYRDEGSKIKIPPTSWHSHIRRVCSSMAASTFSISTLVGRSRNIMIMLRGSFLLISQVTISD